MDGHERRPLSDDALSREIAAGLAVEPSPEYVARIRERIAAEATHPAVGWSWLTARSSVAAFAVLVMMTAGFWMRSFVGTSQRVAVRTSSSRPADVLPAPSAARVPDAPIVEASSRVASARARRDRRAGSGLNVRTAEVQISQDDAIALRQLVEAINARRVDSSAVPELGVPASPLPELDVIVVDQIALSPLVALDAQ